ncbi:hypothetical protein PQX77_020698 [Marasmius sp. AFHP31]|nr:hypothetical protein PQX77_020698 [Marasmius sp. AFHP31]
MGRPRLYNSEQDRREAKRTKDKQYYDRKREEILRYKHVKRERQKKTAQYKKTQERKRQREGQTKKRRLDERNNGDDHTPTSPSRPRPQEIIEPPQGESVHVEGGYEAQLQDLKSEYLAKYTTSYLEDVCEQAVRWKHSTRLLAPYQRSTTTSPILKLRNRLDSKWKKIDDIEDSVRFLIGNNMGKCQTERLQRFSVFKATVGNMVRTFNRVEYKLNQLGYSVKKEDLAEVFRTSFPPCL